MRKHWNRLALLCAFICVLSCTAAAQQRPKLNSAAPAFTLDLVQGSADGQVTLESLKGKAVVLEFWATWCAGCVAQIAHLNSIAESFRDRPVRFVSLTDEDREVVNWFLSKRPIAGWVALDKHGRTFHDYGIVGRPRTVLIDSNGIYRGEMPAQDLTSETLDALLAGTLRIPELADSATPMVGTEANAPSPLVRVLIRPAMSVEQTGMSPGAMRQSDDTWEAWGIGLKTLVSYCFGSRETRVVLPEHYDKPLYDLLFVLPNGNDESRRRILQQAIETTFRAKVRRETRETDVYVLTKVTGREPRLVKSDQGKSVGWVARFAERVLLRPVVDESGVAGRYSFVWESATELATINAQLKDALGLELVPGRRSIEVLVFEPNVQ